MKVLEARTEVETEKGADALAIQRGQGPSWTIARPSPERRRRRGRIHGGKHSPHQTVVATSGLNAPLAHAFEMDPINASVSAAEKTVAQRPEALSANRTRSPAMVSS